jgi:hypothetical protein
VQVWGDVNGDGEVNTIDAALIMQSVAGFIAQPPNQSVADVNDDGRIDSVDAALILQYDAGLIESLA